MELGAEKEYVGISAIYQFLGNGVQVISGSLFYIFAARVFPPSDLGVIALFIAIVGLFGIVFTVGLNSAITHFISSNLNSKVYSPGKTLFRIIVMGTLLALSGFLVIYVSAGYISIIFFHTISDTSYIKLLAIVLFGNIIFSILEGAIIGFEKFKISAFISASIWLIYYFGALSLAYIDRSLFAIIYGWILGLSLGILVEFIYILFFLTKRDLKKQNKAVKGVSIFVYSIPLLFSSIISYGATYVDRFLVAYLLNTYYLGIYTFTLLIFSGISFIVVPFSNISLPKFSELFGNDQKSLIRNSVGTTSLLLSYFYTPTALGIAALSPIVLYYIAGPAYVSGQYALIILMSVPTLFIPRTLLSQAIRAVRKTAFFIYSSAASLATNVILSFLLIPHFGLIGAALAFSSVYVVSYIILYIFAKKENLVHYDVSSTSKIWASSIIMFLVVYISLHFLVSFYSYALFILPLLIIFGIVMYLGMTVILSVFSKNDSEFILSLFPDKLSFLKKLISFIIVKK